MNKLKAGIISAVSVLVIGGASFIALADDKPQGPAETITAYYEEAKSGEVDKAKEYLSKDLLHYRETFSMFGTPDQLIPEDGRKYKKVQPLKDTLKITGQTARMKVKLTYPDGSTETEIYNFIREEGNWKMTLKDGM